MLMPLVAGGKAQAAPAWPGLDASVDVLAMFNQPLAASGPASDGSGSSDHSGGGRRGRGAAQQLPLPPLPFVLPPLPDPAALLGGLPAAAMFGAPGAGLPTMDPAAAAAFMFNPMAAAAAATIAAAATMAEHQQQLLQLEESLADAVSCPAQPPAAAAEPPAGAAPTPAQAPALAATPGAQLNVASALTSHLSDMACPDAEMHGEPGLPLCCHSAPAVFATAAATPGAVLLPPCLAC